MIIIPCDFVYSKAGAFVRKSTSQKLYESVQQPPEISTLKKRMYENPEALVSQFIENIDVSNKVQILERAP